MEHATMCAHPLAGRAATLDEYHSLIRDGILGADDRVQLLRGIITPMTPQGVPHARAIRELTMHLAGSVRGAAEVLVQLPLTLPGDSEPEPDLALVTPEEAARDDSHPHTALLVVEVSRGSLRLDRTLKREIYARAGIPEYWIVNVEERCVEVYREPRPDEGTYASVVRAGETDVLAPQAFPDAGLAVARLFVARPSR